MAYRSVVTLNTPIYDFATKKKLTDEEARKLPTLKNVAVLPKAFNESGEPIAYYLVHDVKKGARFDISKYYNQPEKGKKFPPFIAYSFSGRKISSSGQGKILVLNFLISFDHSILQKEKFRKFLNIVNEDVNFTPVVFSLSGKEEAKLFSKDNNLSLPIVTNAQSFSQKYGIHNFPSYIVVDKEGICAGVFSDVDELKRALEQLK
ncbi:MAG: hypothetical protein WCD31_05265 [Gillisia sp.]